jgi:hypothetical protein
MDEDRNLRSTCRRDDRVNPPVGQMLVFNEGAPTTGAVRRTTSCPPATAGRNGHEFADHAGASPLWRSDQARHDPPITKAPYAAAF